MAPSSSVGEKDNLQNPELTTTAEEFDDSELVETLKINEYKIKMEFHYKKYLEFKDMYEKA